MNERLYVLMVLIKGYLWVVILMCSSPMRVRKLDHQPALC